MGQVAKKLRVRRIVKHKNLASERVRLGLSQGELADKLNVSTTTIHEYENFKRPMTTDFIINASGFFGCSIDYLLDRTDERMAASAMSMDGGAA